LIISNNQYIIQMSSKKEKTGRTFADLIAENPKAIITILIIILLAIFIFLLNFKIAISTDHGISIERYDSSQNPTTKPVTSTQTSPQNPETETKTDPDTRTKTDPDTRTRTITNPTDLKGFQENNEELTAELGILQKKYDSLEIKYNSNPTCPGYEPNSFTVYLMGTASDPYHKSIYESLKSRLDTFKINLKFGTPTGSKEMSIGYNKNHDKGEENACHVFEKIGSDLFINKLPGIDENNAVYIYLPESEKK